mgnify:CR=1 FL=1
MMKKKFLLLLPFYCATTNTILLQGAKEIYKGGRKFLYSRLSSNFSSLRPIEKIEDEKIKDILRLLKTKLACGGSIKDEYIEIQGDLKDKVRVILVDNGWKFKN